MNWFVIAEKSASSSVSIIKSALKKHSVQCVIWNVDSPVAIKDLEKNALSATHVVVINAQTIFTHRVPLFLTGYLMGKKVPFFFTGTIPPEMNSLPETRPPFSSVESLVEAIHADFPLFVAEEKKQSAHSTLFKEGVPFTPDFFAFHIAANHERLCKLFVEAGLDVNSRDAAGTPMLCMAARHNRKELLEWLIAEGADVNAVSKDRGYTAVMDAVWKTNIAIVKTLLAKKADLTVISRDGQSVLVLAVGTGNEEICRLLAENGADPCVKDAMGMSAAAYARLFKKDAIAEVLEKYVTQ